MDKRKKINEIAQLFGVSVPTLHYWEKEGLFTIGRNNENQYRQYSLTDIFNIWEIALYRDLDIPIRDIREILHSELDVQMEAYHQQTALISQKIRHLRRVQNDLQKQVRCGDLAIALDNAGLRPSVPDMDFFLTTPPSIEYSLEHPNDMGIMITAEGSYTGARRTYTRGTCLQHDKGAGTSVRLPRDVSYMEFLLEININDRMDNNLDAICDQLRAQDLQPGTVWGRYLLMGGSLPDRYEYYHGWIEV